MNVQVNSAYAQGLLNNILNPKIAVFFTSLIPQFVTPGVSVPLQSAELATVFAMMGLVWLTVFSILASRTREVLRLPRVKKWLDTVTGVVLVGLGIRVAMETR
jgi:threonine/homoserine/homoserine lactone efflux protein